MSNSFSNFLVSAVVLVVMGYLVVLLTMPYWIAPAISYAERRAARSQAQEQNRLKRSYGPYLEAIQRHRS